MALNIPNIAAPTVEGDFITSSKGRNELHKLQLENEIKRIEAQYAPLTTKADAASKLAYANLTGPQFLAKLFGNEHILANVPEDQKPAILQKLQTAGMGQGTGGNVFGQLDNNQQQSGSNSLAGGLFDYLKNKIMPSQVSGQQSPQSQNALLQSPVQNQVSKGSGIMMPEHPEQKQLEQKVANIPTKKPTFAENVGEYKGIVEEGKETGKNRAADIQKLNDVVFNSAAKQDTLNDITSILTNPVIEQIRSVPLAGHHELSYYAKFGNPEQQQLAGRYYSQMGEFVKASARDFAGQFRKGEQQLLNSMKPNPSDTVDAAKGKVEALALMDRLMNQRAKLTSQIMTKYHSNKLEAQEAADTQINADDIKEEIHNKLNPMITIKNNKTGQTMTIPANDRKKYGV